MNLEKIYTEILHSSVVFLAGRPCSGKTTLGLEISRLFEKSIYCTFGVKNKSVYDRDVIFVDNIFSIEDLEVKITSLSSTKSISFLVIDSIQEVGTRFTAKNRDITLNYIFCRIILMAHRFKIRILVISRLSKYIPERENNNPIWNDVIMQNGLCNVGTYFDKLFVLHRNLGSDISELCLIENIS